MLLSKKEFLEKQLSDLKRNEKQICTKLTHVGKSLQILESSINTESEQFKRVANHYRKYGVELKVIKY